MVRKARAELGRAQVKLQDIVEVAIEVEVKRLLWLVGGWEVVS